MIPKIRKDENLVRQGAHASFIPVRDYNALLRSVGHLKRQGQWVDGGDQFCVYRNAEPAALSSGRGISCSRFIWDGPQVSVEIESEAIDRAWFPAICRGYDSSRFYGSDSDWPLPPIPDVDFTDYVLGLNAQGTSWIVNNRPGNPLAGLDQTLGEAHQVPSIPLLLQSRLRSLKDIGSNYLNVEFGWKPLLKDVQKMYNLTFKIDGLLQKLISNNGIPIRKRSKKLVDHTEELEFEGTFTQPFGHLGDVSKGGHESLSGYYSIGPFGAVDSLAFGEPGSCVYRAEKTKTITTWNCGTFKYYVPDIGSLQWTARAKEKLFGANFTPSTLWEIMPWSWLIDWFSNIGNIVSNLSDSAVDNEALTNAYSMRTEKTVSKLTCDITFEGNTVGIPGGIYWTTYGGGTAHVEYSRLELLKLRQQASPFGFGVPSSDFTPRQWAILAALGISRKR